MIPNPVHGKLIMEYFYPIPLGWLDECPLESHNKLMKKFRRDFTMKIDRKRVMKDLIHRSLDGSDPLVLEASMIDRMKMRPKRRELPPFVHDMVDWQHPYNNLEPW